MKHKKITPLSQDYLLFLERGDKINKSIERFCEENNIVHASYHGIGAISNVCIAQYSVETKTYDKKTYEDTYELLSLVGNFGHIKNEGEELRAFAHSHVTISDPSFWVTGGHLVEGEVEAVVEIYLTAYEEPLKRSHDEITGLNIMRIE